MTMKYIFRSKSIAQKFLILSMLTFIVPLAFFVLFTFRTYSKTIDSKFHQMAQNVLSLVEKNIQYTMNDVSDTGNIIMTSDVVQNILACDPESPAYHQDILNYESDVEELLINLTNNKRYIGSIYLGNSGYSLIKYKTLFSRVDTEQFSYPDEEWMKRTIQADGRGEWYSDTANTYFSEDLIIYTKLIKGLNSLEPLGIMVIGIDKEVFDDLLEDLDDFEGSQIIIWQDDEVLYDSLEGEKSVLYDMDAGTRDRFLRSDGIEDVGFNDKMYVKSTVSRESGWTITFVTPGNILDLDKRSTLILFIMIAILTLLVAGSCSYIVTHNITRTIRKLRDYVDSLRKGKKEQISFDTKDEIGMIGNEFIRVVAENETLTMNLYKSLYREKEAELEVLLAQINPHFLYNALDSIFWMAEEHDIPEISETVVALSKIFRLSLNNGKRTTTVRQELDLVRSYLQIQKVRFEDKLSVDIQVPECVMNISIPKFLLQPLVENAVSHGIAPQGEGGHISISIVEDGEYLYFTVEDDGVGFDVAEKDVLHSGYALKNINERVKMTYGEECGVIIQSEKGKGTKASVRINSNKIPEEKR